MSSEYTVQDAPLPPHVQAGVSLANWQRTHPAAPIRDLPKHTPEPDLRTLRYASIYDEPQAWLQPQVQPPIRRRQAGSPLLWGMVLFPIFAVIGGGSAAFIAAVLAGGLLGWGALVVAMWVGGLVAAGFLFAGVRQCVKVLQEDDPTPSAARFLLAVAGLIINGFGFYALASLVGFP